MGQQINFRDTLLRGLRADKRQPKNSQAAQTYRNIIPRAGGARPYLEVTDPFAAGELAGKGITIAYPYPQIRLMKHKALLLDKTDIFEINTKLADVVAENWTLSTTVKTATIPSVAAHPWHIADFFNSIFLFNGEAVIYNDYTRDEAGNVVTDYVVKTNRTVTTGCAHRGRLVMGGFDTSDFWTTAWQKLLTDRILKSPEAMELFGDIGPNWVWWSSIGGGDATLLWDEEVGVFGHPDIEGYNDSLPFFMDMIKRNEAGFMPIPSEGKVRMLKPLGRHIMVYAHDSIGFLTLVSSPMPTYGYTELLNEGVGNLGTPAGGDDFVHTFLTKGGTFYKITAEDLTPVRLGGEEFGALLIGGGQVLLADFDSLERETWFMTSSDVTIVSRDGQFSQHFIEIPTSITRASRQGMTEVGAPILGLQDTPSLGQNLTVGMETEIFDLGTREVKTLHSVQIDSSLAMTLKVRFRHDSTSAFKTVTIAVDNRGVAVIELSGVDFSLLLERATHTGLELNQILLNFDIGILRVDIEALVNA